MDSVTKRRDFLKKVAVGAAAGATLGTAFAQPKGLPNICWCMVTSWPISLDTIYGGAELAAKRVSGLTGGRFQIRVYAGGEIVGGTQVLDAVQAGTVEMGHTASYYYLGKNPTLAFDTTLPFGLSDRQQNAWQYYGSGQALMGGVFAGFNIISMPAGNTGQQVGGSVNRYPI